MGKVLNDMWSVRDAPIKKKLLLALLITYLISLGIIFLSKAPMQEVIDSYRLLLIFEQVTKTTDELLEIEKKYVEENLSEYYLSRYNQAINTITTQIRQMKSYDMNDETINFIDGKSRAFMDNFFTIADKAARDMEGRSPDKRRLILHAAAEAIQLNHHNYVGLLRETIAKFDGDISRKQQRASRLGMVYAIISTLLYLGSFLFFYFSLHTFIVRPIRKLTTSAEAMSLGRLDIQVTTEARDEVGQLTLAFNRMVTTIRDHTDNLARKVRERTLELEEKNQAIMESIEYAKTLQLAILPDKEVITANCAEHFVVWQPRDIVGGDFYFFKALDDAYLLAVIDCTGHGVPGAFMSMATNSALNRIVTQKRSQPSAIIEELNITIRRALRQDKPSSSSNDGMEIAVCLCRPQERRLIFAGAGLDLFCCRDQQLRQIRGDRQAIGYKKSREDFNYTNHELEVRESDTFYLATDGIFDQTGGKRGFSFGRKRFAGLLVELAGRPLDGQRQEIEAALLVYQGGTMRKDDVTVFGFRVIL